MMFQPTKLLNYLAVTSVLGIVSGCYAAALPGTGIAMVEARAPGPMSPSSMILPLPTTRDDSSGLRDFPDQCNSSDSSHYPLILDESGCCTNDIVNGSAQTSQCGVSAGAIDKGKAQDTMDVIGKPVDVHTINAAAGKTVSLGVVMHPVYDQKVDYTRLMAY
ncbi:hypothetical protein K435DRAFT_877065 [Dendrothele bispora CBS 962.96]|uniref:Uncharacterized protein n=1 Tax=Dendrothele bispora (strain CBS 962.96) TaxID=1314807 RepID=A0A4S8KQQ0_DENBC|nr:hypothetical protein K435DRAFT_877065 [Dendrothele bispora CBS 962.96]